VTVSPNQGQKITKEAEFAPFSPLNLVNFELHCKEERLTSMD